MVTDGAGIVWQEESGKLVQVSSIDQMRLGDKVTVRIVHKRGMAYFKLSS